MTPETPPNKALSVPVPHAALPAADGASLAVPAFVGAAAPAGDGDGPPGLSAAPTVTGLLHALRRRWLLATGLAVVAATGAVAAVFAALPPRYVVEARFFVAAGPETPLIIQAGHDPHGEFIVFKEYQKALIRSPLVLAKALDEKVSDGREARDLPSVRARGNEALGWIEQSLKADFKVAPEIMSVWLTGDNPDELAEVLNAVGAAFVKENDEKEKARRKERLEHYRESLKQKEQDLSTLRAKLDAKRRPEEAKDRLAKERKLQQAQQDLAFCKIQIQNLQVKRDETELELSDVQAKLKAVPTAALPPETVAEYLRGEPAAQALFAQIAKCELDIQEYQNTIKYPPLLEEYVRKERGKQAGLQEKLEKLRDKVAPDLERRHRDKLQAELAEKADTASRRLKLLTAQEQGLRQQSKDLVAQITALDPSVQTKPPDVLHLEDEVESTKAAVDRIRQTILALSVEGGSSRVAMQQRAVPPSDKDYSRQIKLAGAGGTAAIALALFGVALLEFRSRRISGAEEVSRGLGLNVVGTLPPVPARVRAPADREPTGRDLACQLQLQEAVDGIRTMLLHAARTEPLRVVMVSSANGGEGKTTVASQLAASLSRAWRKTLLVDGDLRHPEAHQLFGLAREPGLCEVLRGEVSAEDAIRPAPQSRLWVLPAGQWDSHALQALAQDNVRALFEQLKGQYDFIVVDSCPVLPVADALLLGQHVDGVIVTVMRDVSRAPEVFAAQQRLTSLGIRTLGAVVIGDGDELGHRGYQYAAAQAGS
jgi:capsular exopolysaccharide synthesis family protein